jgi:hypothetical protein
MTHLIIFHSRLSRYRRIIIYGSNNQILKSDLYRVQDRITSLSTVHIYTDGSLSTTKLRSIPPTPDCPDNNIEVEQGAAFLIPELDIHVSTNLSLWPSSELTAIFLALLVCAQYTDSAASIAVFSRDPNTITASKWAKTSNDLLVMKI